MRKLPPPPPHIERHLKHMKVRNCTDDAITARRRVLTRVEIRIGAPLTEVLPAELELWADEIADEVEPETLASYISHVQCWCKWALTAGVIDRDPSLLLPRVKIRRHLPRPISEADLAAAIAAAPARIRPWLALAAGAGLRCREIAFLRREDVHDQAGNPALLISTDAAKGGDERIIPLSPWVMQELEPVLRGVRRGFLFRRSYSALSAGPVPPWRVSQLGGAHLRECGIDATMHMLRHRFLTQAYLASKDLRLVQELAGHKSPITTAGYVAWSRANAREVVGSLPVPGRAKIAALAGPLLCAVAVMHGAAAGAAVHHSRRRPGTAIIQTWRGGGGRLTVG